jgi:hypothetical protein
MHSTCDASQNLMPRSGSPAPSRLLARLKASAKRRATYVREVLSPCGCFSGQFHSNYLTKVCGHCGRAAVVSATDNSMEVGSGFSRRRCSTSTKWAGLDQASQAEPADRALVCSSRACDVSQPVENMSLGSASADTTRPEQMVTFVIALGECCHRHCVRQ